MAVPSITELPTVIPLEVAITIGGTLCVVMGVLIGAIFVMVINKINDVKVSVDDSHKRIDHHIEIFHAK